MSDVFLPKPYVEQVAVRVERSQVFVAREAMDGYKALGGLTLHEAGIDPDTPLPEATTLMIKAWGDSHDGILGYLAQWGLLEAEVLAVHRVKVYVNGALAYEGNLADGI